MVQLDFGQLHLVDAVSLQDAATQGSPVRFILPWSSGNGHP